MRKQCLNETLKKCDEVTCNFHLDVTMLEYNNTPFLTSF